MVVWVSELPYPECCYVLSSGDQSRLGNQGIALLDKALGGTCSCQEQKEPLVSASQRMPSYRRRTSEVKTHMQIWGLPLQEDGRQIKITGWARQNTWPVQSTPSCCLPPISTDLPTQHAPLRPLDMAGSGQSTQERSPPSPSLC